MERVKMTEIDFNDDHSYSYHGRPFTGVAFEQTSEGKLISEIAFVEGVKEGQTREWYTTGAQRFEKNYRYNALHGEGREWLETGRLKKRTLHELGVLLEKDEWDEEGNLIFMYRLTESDSNYKILQQLRLAKWK
jgi:antitoxin component YwqK of YwqJK toxin-antitoxin module